MQAHAHLLLGLMLVVAGAMASGGVVANPMQGMHSGHKMQSGMASHGKQKAGHHGSGMHGKMGGKLLTPHWKKTLTSDQKLQIDLMHLELTKAKLTLRNRIKLLKTELALLSTADVPNREVIGRKIDEILASKRNMMLIQADHIVKMRKVLNSQQRISFDMHVLKKSRKGRGKKH